MRKMYSESQLIRLIKENSSGIKDYNHHIMLNASNGTYVVDFRLTSSQSEAYTASTLGTKFTRVQFAARIYDADNKTYHCGFVSFSLLGQVSITLNGASAEITSSPFSFQDTVTED